MSVKISVVVPVYNEAESVGILHDQLREVLERQDQSYELVFIDDGSTDGTLEALARRVSADPHLRVVSLRRNCGKAAALSTGFREAAGEVIITMDGDLQDDPQEIPQFLAHLDEGYDLVSGWKRERHDPLTKRWPSRLFNFVTASVSGVRLHDFNCGFKAYRREVARSVRIYGELYRFIPVLADGLGFRIGEREVRHRPRRHGRSKYGAARFINGFLDLLTVMFLGRSRRSPLHLFGRIGFWTFVAGMIINLYMLGIWIHERALRVRPLLIAGVILLVMAVQFVSMGLLAEIMVSARREEDEEYPIRCRLPEGKGGSACAS